MKRALLLITLCVAMGAVGAAVITAQRPIDVELDPNDPLVDEWVQVAMDSPGPYRIPSRFDLSPEQYALYEARVFEETQKRWAAKRQAIEDSGGLNNEEFKEFCELQAKWVQTVEDDTRILELAPRATVLQHQIANYQWLGSYCPLTAAQRKHPLLRTLAKAVESSDPFPAQRRKLCAGINKHHFIKAFSYTPEEIERNDDGTVTITVTVRLALADRCSFNGGYVERWQWDGRNLKCLSAKPMKLPKGTWGGAIGV